MQVDIYANAGGGCSTAMGIHSDFGLEAVFIVGDDCACNFDFVAWKSNAWVETSVLHPAVKVADGEAGYTRLIQLVSGVEPPVVDAEDWRCCCWGSTVVDEAC